jgi:membrane-associated phospholipid phosphatase
LKQTAKVISLVLNPFIMPFFGVLLVFKFHDYFSIVYHQDFVNTLLIIGALLTIVFPLISIFVLYKSKMISDLYLSKKEERIIPIIVTLSYYFAFYYIIRKPDGISETILAGYLGGCVALIISAFITPRWKISLHAQGISSLAGMFIGITQATFVNQPEEIISIIICVGFLGTSRLILHKHTTAQVLAGTVLGFTVPYLFVLNGWTI